MKRINFYLALALLMVGAVGCNDDYDVPPIVVPTAEHEANMTIADFKAKYWQSARNFIDTCKEETYLHGYVTSSDEAGNIYKYIFIQDETGGIGISIDANSLSTTYRVGQEIVLDMTDKWIGKYNGNYLIGLPEWYSAQSVWEAGRLPLETFESMVEINGLPDVDKVTPVVTKISDFQGKSDSETILKYSGQLVKIQNVTWAEADGVTTYSESDASSYRILQDEDGNTVNAVNSNYATFRDELLPLGSGDVIGILTLTGTDTWNFYLRDTDDCIGFSTDTKGTENDPYTVEEAIEIMDTERSGWVTGYVVGAVAPEVTTVSSNSDIEWKAPTTLANTIVIAQSADVTDYTKCIVVPLPQDSKFREQANLKDNDVVYKTQIWVKGTFATYMGTYGITDNSGSTSEYKLSVVSGGVTELYEDFSAGSIPSDWYNVQVEGTKTWYTPSYDSNYYAAMTGYLGTAPFDSWLITPALDIKNATNKILSFRTQVNGYSSTTTRFEVYVMSTSDPTTATLTQLSPTIATAPSSGYSSWAQRGALDHRQFDDTYFIGFSYVATADDNYATWCVDDVKFGEGSGTSSGGDDTDDPVDVGNRADLETMNSGSPKSTYGSLTSTNGWVAANCNLLQGGTTDSNPVFTFLGLVEGTDTYAMGTTLNGKTSAVGTLTSPTITSIGELTFNYAMPYTDSTLSVRVDVTQTGSVVYSEEVTESSPTKYQVYSKTISVQKSGGVQVVFTNLSPSAVDSNKDRVCIWNITWTDVE